MKEDVIPVNWEVNRSIIKVMGVGGGGSNAVNHMFRTGIKDVSFIVCNTDAQALRHSPVPEKLQLGETITKGRGAGCDPGIARKAALESKDKIAQLLSDSTEMIFITAGMGGGTGTGAAPVIAEIAKSMGLLTVGVVTLPFRDEGLEILNRALDGIHEMQKHVDSLLVIDSEKLYKVFGDLPVSEAFPKADDVLSTAVKGIAEIVTLHGYINVDFNDVKMVMKESGMALMGSGSASGEDRARKAVEEAFTSPLLNDVDLSSAHNVLVNITSGKEKGLRMNELAQIMRYIEEYTGVVSNFKRGVVTDPSLGDTINVTIVATGFNLSNLPLVFNDKELPDESVSLEGDPHVGWGGPTEVFHSSPSTGGFSIGNDEGYYYRQDPALRSGMIANKPTITPKGTPALILAPGEKITDYENVPAYVRQQTRIHEEAPSEAEISPLKIEEQHGKQRLSTNNAYIHQTQD